jgi:hypothetical protein
MAPNLNSNKSPQRINGFFKELRMHMNHKYSVLTLMCFGSLFLVSSPIACGLNGQAHREPIALVGDNTVSNSPSGEEPLSEPSRVSVEPDIAHVAASHELPLSHENISNIKSDDTLFEPQVQPNFCEGLNPGECLTLVIQAPGMVMQSSLGLGVLGLALASPSYSALLHRTCTEGLKVGLPVIEAGLPLHRRNGVAKKMFSTFKRSRCVYQVLNNDRDAPMKPEWNETALKVRLVDFALSGRAVSTNPVLAKIEFLESKMLTRFHDVAIHAPTGGLEQGWQPVRGGWNVFSTSTYSGIFKTTEVNIAIKRGLLFQVNGFGVASYLNQVLEPFLNESTRTESISKAKAQVEMIRIALRSLRQGKSIVTSSLVLVGMGLDAIKDICEAPGSDCRLQDKNSDLVTELTTAFDHGNPLPSASKALLIDALKYIPLGLLRGVYQHADTKNLLDQMKVIAPEANAVHR